MMFRIRNATPMMSVMYQPPGSMRVYNPQALQYQVSVSSLFSSSLVISSTSSGVRYGSSGSCLRFASTRVLHS